MMRKDLGTTMLFLLLAISLSVQAGNDTKRGQAGAGELLINPFARNIGMSNAYSAGVRGLESMWLNLGGLAFTRNIELNLTSKLYLMGSDVNVTSFGFAKNLTPVSEQTYGYGSGGVFGAYAMIVDMGEIIETTENQPEGTGRTIQPQIFNFALAYSRAFSDFVSAGLLVRTMSQSIPEASALGVSIDFGVQYRNRSGRLKGGISLKNLGPKMRYNGPGFNQEARPNTYNTFDLKLNNPREPFELPIQLILGAAYDAISDSTHRLTPAFSFAANSFTNDDFNFGVEYAFREMFMARIGYGLRQDVLDESTQAHTGFTAGVTLNLPWTINKAGDGEPREAGLAIDYAYQTSNPFAGTHSFGATLKF